jgi:cell division septation protein DedD
VSLLPLWSELLKTRLLGAAVLLLLLVIFVPMFFASKPPTAAGDQSVSLAIPPAPDRDLQTKTMSLAPNAPAGSASSGTASSDHLATVDIGSRRPRDVGTDAAAGTQPSVTTGSGDSASQPVIPMQGQASAPAPRSAAPPPSRPEPVASQPATGKPAPVEETPAPSAATATDGSYTLNLSAYASASGAARLVRRVHALGYPATGHVITQAGKQRTLVIAGPFETRTAAEAARLKITQSIPGAPARLQQDAGQASSAVPASRATPSHAGSRPGGFAVQLVAVSSKADAEALRNKLRANGFDGFVDSVRSGGKRLWRVRAGPQTQRADAQRVQNQIKAKLGIDGVVVSVP